LPELRTGFIKTVSPFDSQAKSVAASAAARAASANASSVDPFATPASATGVCGPGCGKVKSALASLDGKAVVIPIAADIFKKSRRFS
jgi:hypothetical protein